MTASRTPGPPQLHRLREPDRVADREATLLLCDDPLESIGLLGQQVLAAHIVHVLRHRIEEPAEALTVLVLGQLPVRVTHVDPLARETPCYVHREVALPAGGVSEDHHREFSQHREVVDQKLFNAILFRIDLGEDD